MKKILLNPTAWLSIALLAAATLVFTACDNDEDPKAAPTVTTAAPADVTPSSAVVAGDITSDGGEIILAAGICYSATNTTPTVPPNDTTKTTVLTGKFASRLKSLASGTTYHVRAYATNSVGTSYGEVMTFTTGNEAPTATNVVINGISGDIKGDLEVDVTYKYDDKEGDKELGTIIQWYRADNFTGANTVAIKDATTSKYRINDADQGKVIWVGVTPKAATGTLVGVESNSEKKGPVGEATTVTFMYDGKSVTYGIWGSTKTGRLWMDRNLGAPNAPAAFNDYANLGDLFQWGRLADGHQLIIRTPNATNPLAGISTPRNTDLATKLSSSTTPPDNKFITPSEAPFDWISQQNNNLWQGSIGTNNPCPAGWHIPTADEWNAEELTNDAAANYDKIRLTRSGQRVENSGSIVSSGSGSFYWSSTASGTQALTFGQTSANDPSVYEDYRAKGRACRCIKDENK